MGKNRKQNKEDKKREVDEALEKDTRFSTVKKDPRFKPIRKKQNKVAIDDRFKGAFDKSHDEKKNSLVVEKEGYLPEKDDKKENINALEAKMEELNRLARGEVSDVESSSESEEETPVVPAVEEEEEEKIEDGEATHRLAVVNLNWDVISAVDLLAVFKSFCQGGSVYSVTIYPSEYGKKKMADEEKYGPEGHVVEEDIGFDDEDYDDEKNIDEMRLRKYEKERMRYYFAVVDCDNLYTANTVYENTDGTEFMRTGAMLDLRFIPDDMQFDNSMIKEKATFVPENYTPTVTSGFDANTHSNVSLTWDGDEKKRDNALIYGRSNKKNEKGEIDYSNYIASSDSEESEDEEEIRKKYNGLLKLNKEDANDEEDSEDDVLRNAGDGDADITFIPGLKDSIKKGIEKKEEEEPQTVYEEYKRKLKEKRKERKNGRKEEEEDMDIEDGADLFANLDKGKKEKKKKKVERRPNEDKERAELELLMIDEKDEMKHNFDMKQIKEAEKTGKKHKGKKREQDDSQIDNFEINTEDPRFSGLVNNSDYSIDVTNPQFVKTKNMSKLVNSVTKKRKVE